MCPNDITFKYTVIFNHHVLITLNTHTHSHTNNDITDFNFIITHMNRMEKRNTFN